MHALVPRKWLSPKSEEWLPLWGKEEAVISQGCRKNFWGAGMAWAVINGCVSFEFLLLYIFFIHSPSFFVKKEKY